MKFSVGKPKKILKICAVTPGTGNLIILMVTNDRKNNLVFVQSNKITQIYKNNSPKCQNHLTFGEFVLYNIIAYRSITIKGGKRKCSKKH